MQNVKVTLCYPDLLKYASLFYHLVSFASRMVHLIWQSWLKTGLPPTAVNLLAKMNSYQTRWTLTSRLGSHFVPSQRTLIS